MTAEEREDLKEAARGLIYWDQVPVRVTIGGTESPKEPPPPSLRAMQSR
jgi:hypothetical protein